MCLHGSVSLGVKGLGCSCCRPRRRQVSGIARGFRWSKEIHWPNSLSIIPPFVLLVFLLPPTWRKPLLCGRPTGQWADKPSANGPEFRESTMILQVIAVGRVGEEWSVWGWAARGRGQCSMENPPPGPRPFWAWELWNGGAWRGSLELLYGPASSLAEEQPLQSGGLVHLWQCTMSEWFLTQTRDWLRGYRRLSGDVLVCKSTHVFPRCPWCLLGPFLEGKLQGPRCLHCTLKREPSATCVPLPAIISGVTCYPTVATGATLIKTWNYCQPFHSTPASALFLCLLQAHPAWSSVQTQQHLANKHTAMARSQPSLLPVCEVPPTLSCPGAWWPRCEEDGQENGHALWERAETGGLCEPSCGLLLRFVQTQGFSEGLLLPFRV